MVRPRHAFSPAHLATLLDWDADTGALFWKARHEGMLVLEKHITAREAKLFNTACAGARADRADARGYKVFQIRKNPFLAHRVIWGFHTGEWPSSPLDHVNGDRGDNRLCNLRAVSTRENNINKALDSRNRFGCHGIVEIKRLDRYAAMINIEGKTLYLGSYKTVEEAVRVRRRAEQDYGYHPNHGRTT